MGPPSMYRKVLVMNLINKTLMKLTRMNEVGVDRDEPVRLEVHEDADD